MLLADFLCEFRSLQLCGNSLQTRGIRKTKSSGNHTVDIPQYPYLFQS